MRRARHRASQDRFQTRERLAPWLRKLNEGRPPRYSRALLETIAIVAYRQPVTRGDIEDIRGVAVSTEIMRTLQERDWIKQVGVRDAPGHPALYGTTPAFLAYFNLESLKELPALIEQRDLELIAREQNIQLPVPETEGEDAQSGEQSDTLVEGDVDDNGIDSPDEPATGPESAKPTAESETADESPRGDSGSRPAADDSGGAGTSRGE